MLNWSALQPNIKETATALQYPVAGSAALVPVYETPISPSSAPTSGTGENMIVQPKHWGTLAWNNFLRT